MSDQKRRKKRQLLNVYGAVCYLCRMEFPEDKLSIEHKTPTSRGGSNAFNNLGLACKPCNEEKADMTVEEYEYYLTAKPGYLNQMKLQRQIVRKGKEKVKKARKLDSGLRYTPNTYIVWSFENQRWEEVSKRNGP